MTQKTVIALGFFDGLHLGHAELLKQTLEVAKLNDAVPAMMTFDVPPLKISSGSELITSPEERAALARDLFGIDDVIVLQFDDNLRNMKWSDFLDWLISDFGAIHFVVGHDFRFGKNAQGNADLILSKMGVHCSIVPPVMLEGTTISSTLIRNLLRNGDVEFANKYLGHRHRLTDVVRFGFKLGRTIGTPTINMKFPDGVLIPKFGVYATRLQIEDEPEILRAVTNIGVRPTIANSDAVTVESYILDFDRIVYGKRVRLEFEKFIRPEMKFDSLDELKTQIGLDAEQVRRL